MRPYLLRLIRDQEKPKLYVCGEEILCRPCIKEREADPRFEGDNPNNWIFTDLGREEANSLGLGGVWLTQADLTPERIAAWFEGNYHPRFKGQGRCSLRGTICMTEQAIIAEIKRKKEVIKKVMNKKNTVPGA